MRAAGLLDIHLDIECLVGRPSWQPGNEQQPDDIGKNQRNIDARDRQIGQQCQFGPLRSGEGEKLHAKCESGPGVPANRSDCNTGVDTGANACSQSKGQHGFVALVEYAQQVGSYGEQGCSDCHIAAIEFGNEQGGENGANGKPAQVGAGDSSHLDF